MTCNFRNKNYIFIETLKCTYIYFDLLICTCKYDPKKERVLDRDKNVLTDFTTYDNTNVSVKVTEMTYTLPEYLGFVSMSNQYWLKDRCCVLDRDKNVCLGH